MIRKTPEEANLIREGRMDYRDEEAAKALAPKIERAGVEHSNVMDVVRRNNAVIAGGGLATAAVMVFWSFNTSERLADFGFLNGGAERVEQPGNILNEHMEDERHQQIQNIINQGITSEQDINQYLGGEE